MIAIKLLWGIVCLAFFALFAYLFVGFAWSTRSALTTPRLPGSGRSRTGGSEDDIDAFEDESGLRHTTASNTCEMEEGMTVQIKVNRIAPLVAAGAAAVAIAAAPSAAATTLATGSTVNQNPGNVEITAEPGAATSHAAQLQQPFGGDNGALIFHHGGPGAH